MRFGLRTSNTFRLGDLLFWSPLMKFAIYPVPLPLCLTSSHRPSAVKIWLGYCFRFKLDSRLGLGLVLGFGFGLGLFLG